MKKLIALFTLTLLIACNDIEPLRLMIGVDCSASAYRDPGYSKLVLETSITLADRLLPKDYISLARFSGHYYETRFAAPVPSDLHQLANVLKSDFALPCDGWGSPITTALEKLSLDDSMPTAIVLITDGVLADDPRANEFAGVLEQVLAKPHIKRVYVTGLDADQGWRDLVSSSVMGQDKITLSSIADNQSNITYFIKAIGR